MKKRLLSAGAALAAALSATPAQAQIDQQLGDVIMVGFTYCPQGWAEASGGLLSIASYSALFSLMGPTYGGDGTTTFALPDLRGRIPVHAGTGPGLSTINRGQKTGDEEVTLGIANLPPHNHLLLATDAGNDTTDPDGNSFTRLTGANQVGYASPTNTTMDTDIVGTTGGAVPLKVTSPTTTLRYCVALTGNFPSRN